jgi:epoxyqueuosine reductase
MDAPEIKGRLKAEAQSLGFSLFGVAPATAADGFDRYAAWLDRGFHGEMDYLEEHREARRHPASVFEGVRTVAMLGLEYGRGSGGVAAYARGPDYHRYIWDRVNHLRDWLAVLVPGARSHGVTDSAPLLERDFARRAGLGWFGKNTMLINKHRGSFFFLAALLTNLDLPADEPHAGSHCGTCRACLDACPTQAFVGPGTLDARKCISYLTIETKTPFPLELREAVGDWLFGCDVCQDVCPWNRHAGPGSFPTDPSLSALEPLAVLRMSKAAFRARFKGTPLYRPGWHGLRRNAAVVLGNVGESSALPHLEAFADDANEVVRDAVRWAIGRIHERHPV